MRRVQLMPENDGEIVPKVYTVFCIYCLTKAVNIPLKSRSTDTIYELNIEQRIHNNIDDDADKDHRSAKSIQLE